MSAPLTPFRPVRWLPGAHLQTIVPSVWRLAGPAGAPEQRRVDLDADNAVRLDVDRPAGAARGTLVLLHGMGGSSESSYMRATARAAVAAGWVTARMNLRNCGGTAAWSRTLYNAGQSDDVAAVLADLDRAPDAFPRPRVAAGFSLGGNIVLRYAGRSGASCAADAVAGINAPIDLAHCLQALERPSNRPYELHYVRRLCRQIEQARTLRTVEGPAADPRAVRTLRRFDDLFTAPDAGYASADEYYAKSSAAAVFSRIARPTLVLSARNDPFVPVEMFVAHEHHPGATFLHPPTGGHCGYWQRGEPRNWAAQALLEFFEAR